MSQKSNAGTTRLSPAPSDVSVELQFPYPTGRKSSVEEISKSGQEVQRARDAISSKKSSFFFVSESFESLNYTQLANQLEMERQKTQKFDELMVEDCVRIVYFILTGICTALIGIFMEYSIEKLGHFKFDKVNSYVEDHFESYYEIAINTIARFVGVIIPVMIGSSLVVFIAPYAVGGGVSLCIGYLNGIRVPKVLSIRGLVVKALSTVCTCISGLAGGKEGPMIHMGAISGGSLPSVLPWQVFRSDQERRDLAAAGFGAGMAVVFHAPIGGLLLALEEGVSFWDISLMWKIYLSCVVAYAVGTIVFSVVIGEEVGLNNPHLLTLGHISSDVTNYELFEIFPYALMAVFGGLFGALMVKIYMYVTFFRQRIINTNTKKMLAAFVVSCLVASLQLLAIRGLRNCSKLTERELKEFEDDSATRRLHRLYCASDEHSDMSVLLSQTQGEILRTFFGTQILQMSSLGVFAVIYLLVMFMTWGITVSYGIFVPQIILGAAWGRMFGTFLNQNISDADWARPAKYAYIGAAAQLSGTVGKTFSVLVILVEASGSISFSFPLMVVVSITKVVCEFFAMPIYETQMHLMGLPFLPTRAPPLSMDIPTTRIMSQPPLVTLPAAPTVETILDTVRTNNHHGYPIIEDGKEGCLLGLILRQQLLILLKHKAYKFPPPKTNKEMCECLDLYLKDSRRRLNLQAITDSVKTKYYGNHIDLTPYYNAFPCTVHETMPAIKTYTVFRNLALRHLIVTSKGNQPIAMVTRKDLAKFHTFENFFRKGVKEMLIKS